MINERYVNVRHIGDDCCTLHKGVSSFSPTFSSFFVQYGAGMVPRACVDVHEKR
jgi:hypothetical protein